MLFSLVARPLPVNFLWVNPYLLPTWTRNIVSRGLVFWGLETGAPGPLRLRGQAYILHGPESWKRNNK